MKFGKNITALYLAAQNGHLEVIKLLTKHPKIKINEQTSMGASAADVAKQLKHEDCYKFLMSHGGRTFL